MTLDTYSNKNVVWVAWNDVLAKEDVGGLAISSLRSLNLALISKLWWRLKVETESLWSKVIRSFHGYRRALIIDPLDTKKRGIWRSISDVNNQLHSYNIDLKSFLVSNNNIGQQIGSTSWSWRLDSSGLFTVSSLRRFIDDSILGRVGFSVGRKGLLSKGPKSR